MEVFFLLLFSFDGIPTNIVASVVRTNVLNRAINSSVNPSYYLSASSDIAHLLKVRLLQRKECFCLYTLKNVYTLPESKIIDAVLYISQCKPYITEYYIIQQWFTSELNFMPYVLFAETVYKRVSKNTIVSVSYHKCYQQLFDVQNSFCLEGI